VKPTRTVLDASAILALLNDEPGAERVMPHVGEGLVSAVNAAEVIGKLMDSGMPEHAAFEALNLLALEVVDFDAGLAGQTGALSPLTRRAGLSLGDRACLATAARLGLPAVTADRRWARLRLGIPVELVR